MFNPYDPRRVFIDPNPSSATIPFPYASATDSAQVPLGPRPEGNIVYLTPPYPSQVSGNPSASNSTTEFSNSQLLGIHSANHKTSEASTPGTIGASGATAASVSLVNLMQQPQPPSNVSYDPARMSSSTTTSFSRYPATQSGFSQPNTPMQATQPQMLQQSFVLQAHSPTQTFTASSAAGTPPARQRLMLISGPAPATAMSPFYTYQAAAGTAAAIQCGSSHHPPSTTTQIISPLQLTSPNPQGNSGSGNFAYVVESGSPAPLLAYSVSQSSFVRVASPPWPPAAGMPMLSSTSGTPTMASHEGTSGADAALLQSPTQQPFSPSTAMRSQSHCPGSFLGPSEAAPTSTSPARAGGTTAAAGGSPDGMQPAALGVRNFSAPEPVGSCLLPNVPLDPIIPPLALPCPRWGKLPRS
ncbi:hypothetical protein, unknown function [Leishmania tarentolae]|uniref:Uncharacterized protein n=1 Tax=Leishmania tarentolae TaxID=5689 RepID=A0A640KLC2_LEITA|nr:hypothetical protein, unknown function [Leishmania tarentolae]